ncbi:MAG: hypothetical protein K2X32_04870 [Phycisphaerales bacterium]|nr:hypothetical protein [Phycisphaerales bacterium]
MATSTKTFDQVKSILGKLDQRIDALRSQRITGQTPAVPAGAAQPQPPTPTTRADAMTDGPNLSTVIGAGSQERGVENAAKTNAQAQTNKPANTTPPGPIPMGGASAAPTRPNAPASKYGRATPLRNIG